MPLKLLAHDTIIEPLIGSWYAWTHLFSPLAAASHISYRHIPIMRSFIDDPAAHLAATADQELRGGPFVEAGTAEQVQALLENTLQWAAPIMALAEDYRSFDQHFMGVADGRPMDDFYGDAPNSLRGALELVYTANDLPMLRVSEFLMSARNFYLGERQLRLERCPSELRSFIMSTPRFESEQAVHIPLDFTNPAITRLVSARRTPADTDQLAAELGVPTDRRDVFGRMFELPEQRGAVQSDPTMTSDGLRCRYTGHAGVLIQSRASTVMVDPCIATNPSGVVERWSFHDLPERIDVVMMTHGHQDHVILESLIQIRDRVALFVVPRCEPNSPLDPSIARALRSFGMHNVLEVGEGDEVPLLDGRILACPFFGEHGDLAISGKVTYHLRAGGRSAFFGADCTVPDKESFVLLAEQTGATDCIFIGMESKGAPYSWLYGPLLSAPPDRTNDIQRTLAGSNADMAMDLLSAFGTRKCRIYAMGLDPWVNHITTLDTSRAGEQLEQVAKFLKLAEAAGIEASLLQGKAEVTL
jgi:L-ascorbate metabolism protein UlaG (beta-lactamase superfamily)